MTHFYGVDRIGKSKYEYWLTQEGLTLLGGWARDGLTDEQIAHKCGIAVSTLYEWKKRFPQLDEVLRRGKAVVDIEVENALLRRALGFTHIERQTVMSKRIEYNASGKKESETTEPTVVEVEHYHPPDVRAQLFWLKNRKPEQWRERQQVEVDADGPIEITLSDAAKEYLV